MSHATFMVLGELALTFFFFISLIQKFNMVDRVLFLKGFNFKYLHFSDHMSYQIVTWHRCSQTFFCFICQLLHHKTLCTYRKDHNMGSTNLIEHILFNHMKWFFYDHNKIAVILCYGSVIVVVCLYTQWFPWDNFCSSRLILLNF